MPFDTFIVYLEKNVEIWIFTMVLEKQILKSRPLNNHQSVPLGEYRVLYQTGLHTEPFKVDTIVLLSKCCTYRLSGLFSSLMFSVESCPPAQYIKSFGTCTLELFLRFQSYVFLAPTGSDWVKKMQSMKLLSEQQITQSICIWRLSMNLWRTAFAF